MVLQWQGKSEQSRNGEEEKEERCVTFVCFFQVSLSYRFTINVSLYELFEYTPSHIFLGIKMKIFFRPT